MAKEIFAKLIDLPGHQALIRKISNRKLNQFSLAESTMINGVYLERISKSNSEETCDFLIGLYDEQMAMDFINELNV